MGADNSLMRFVCLVAAVAYHSGQTAIDENWIELSMTGYINCLQKLGTIN